MKFLFKKVRVVSSILWTTLCFWALFDFLSNDNDWMDAELIQLFQMKMMLLTLPLGYAVVMIGYFIAELIEPFVKFNLEVKTGFYVTFMCMFIAGYFQWFVFIPWAYRKIMAFNKRR